MLYVVYNFRATSQLKKAFLKYPIVLWFEIYIFVSSLHKTYKMNG